jgi:glycosyltransferase involved in cell wall biosynthesis
MKPTPILIWSDTPSAPTGLARICRDLATRIAKCLPDAFRVATVGYGAPGSAKLPFPQYHWHFRNDWYMPELPDIWEDFSQGESGILFTIQDPARVLWLSRPETCTDTRLQNWLKKRPFSLHGYFPIDATGPNDRLSVMLKECFIGYDRILCYSEWARKIVANTIGEKESTKRDLDQLPHGIDTSVFYPRPRARQRQMFGQMSVGREVAISDDELLVGIVATNQARKDYGLGIATCAELAKTRKVRLWVHTDVMDRHWSIPYLLADFGLTGGNLISLGQFSDDTMAKLYSACDVTLAIGLGEGYGYPIFESLACGCPVIHGHYGGASEHLPSEMLAEPQGSRIEGIYSCVRPVFSPQYWSEKVLALEPKLRHVVPPHLDWGNLWPRWESWFRKGVA